MVAYSFKRRFVESIRAGLSSVALSFDPHPKLQTVRAIGKRRHARPGETLQLYHGLRSSKCFKIGDAKCTGVCAIRIFINANKIVMNPATDYEKVYSWAAQLDNFARENGFKDWGDMQAFWHEEHADTVRLGPFAGLLIKWEPMR